MSPATDGTGGCPDRIVVVDWSAAARPRTGRDSIWQADLGPGGALALTNPATRTGWAAAASASLGAQVAAGDRVLLAIDAGLGFPCGLAAALGCSGGDGGAGAGAGGERGDRGAVAWRSVCRLLDELVSDDAANANNRFDVADELNRRCGATGPTGGPFWGHPHGRSWTALGPRRPTPPLRTASGVVLDEWRDTEEVARRAGWRIQPVWKLFGAGSVGSQTLLALTWVERLRREPALSGRLRVWPQDTGATPDPWGGEPGVVVVECWPPAFVDVTAHDVRDAAQVIGTARHLRDRCRWDRVPAPAAEEGWIVGLPM